MSHLQSQLIIYVADEQKDVWITPYYYFNAYDWTRMRFRKKKTQLLFTDQTCRNKPKNEGKFNKLLREKK